MGQISSYICDDVTSPAKAYERAHELCVQAVTFEKTKTAYVGSAIASLTEAGQFGSWLRKLFHRENVTIHLHYYERLIRIIEKQAEEQRRQIDHVDELIKIAKGKRHGTRVGGMERFGGVRAPEMEAGAAISG